MEFEMVDQLEERARTTIDRCIRSFDPSDPPTVHACDSQLAELEEQLSTAAKRQKEVLPILSLVRGHRVSLLSQGGKHASAVEMSERLLREGKLDSLALVMISFAYVRSLHEIGRHSDEISATLDLAMRPEIQGGDLIAFLDLAVGRHQGSIETAQGVEGKVAEAVARLRAGGYEVLPAHRPPRLDFERWVVDLADKLRSEHNRLSAETLGMQ